MKRDGTLFGVGVGPGDPELMTFKAARILRECDVIAIPSRDRNECFAFRIASEAVPEILRKPVLEISLPMTRNMEEREKAYNIGSDLLCSVLSEGKNAAFLTIGDPTVYSTFCYILEKVAAQNFSTVIIPGVTSFCAAAAALSMPLCTDREELHIIPSHGSYERTLAYSGTKVFMKGDLSRLTETLSEHNMDVCAVENCGTREEKQYRSLDDIPADAGYYTVIIAKERKL